MTVDGEHRAVEAGELVHIPPNADHGIKNTGDRRLEYVSAAPPAVAVERTTFYYPATTTVR